MRIGLVGGGTGGHFYPLMAVSEKIREKYLSEKVSLFYFGPNKYDEKYLKDLNINFVKIPAGKMRLYSSGRNYLDTFKVFFGVFIAMLKLPIVYPDVIFSKGGYTAFPVLCAARVLGIPVVVHDSDTVPGRVSIFGAKFAMLVSTAWAEAAKYFVNTIHISPDKIMETGLPIRRILNPLYKQEKLEKKFTFIDKSLPLIAIIGGSQGSQILNESIISCLPFVLPFAQIIHQTGKNNFQAVKHNTDNLLQNMPEKKNYFIKDTFDAQEMREIYSEASLMILRSGSQVLETYLWGIPSILIPISEEVSRDQRSNAFASMRRGASIVIEEHNLTPHILQNEVLRLLQDNRALTHMSASARESAIYDADQKIAETLIKISQDHYL